MRFRIVILGLLVAVATLGLVSDVRADGALLVAGKASPRQQAVLVEAVIATARELGWTLKPHAFSDKEGAELTACLRAAKPWPCAAPYVKDKGDRLVVVHVGAEGADTVLTVHVITSANDTDSTANYFCNACDEDSLKLAIADVARRMLRVAAERSGKTKLSIKSKPDRAWINLDGALVGSTDTVKATYPGEHTVLLTRAGYVTATRTIVIKEGETAELVAVLEPAPGTVIDRDHDRRTASSRWIPKLLSGAGALAVIGGALYSFTVDPPSGGKQPRYLYSGPALGVAAAGGAMLGIGLYLWLRPTGGTTRRSAPTVSPSPGGGAVGWSTSF